MKLRYRSIWISDTHLGIPGCRAAELARFLKHVRCRHLYLVGDIVDMQRLRGKWFWTPEHNAVVRRLLKHVKRGTRVLYIPGNHDDVMRRYAFVEFAGVKVVREATHETADGRKLWITHGDQFDLVVQGSPWLAALGGWAYDQLIIVNRFYNRVTGWFGRPYHSLSHAIKLKVKSACTFISRFEQALSGEGRRRGFDGVVCGHIHKAEVRQEMSLQPGHAAAGHGSETAEGGPRPFTYYNCGDWIESCTALVEHADGRMEVIDGLAVVEELTRQKAQRRLARRSQERGAEPSTPTLNAAAPHGDRLARLRVAQAPATVPG